jgi:hypothetical protein
VRTQAAVVRVWIVAGLASKSKSPSHFSHGKPAAELLSAVTMAQAKPERSARYLSVDERATIADLQRSGIGVRAIAAQVGRAPSRVSRELRGNANESRRYLPHTARRLRLRVRGRY